MFLTKDSSSPFYQVVYFVAGKRTKKSTKTSKKNEAANFLKSFQPNQDLGPKTNKLNFVKLSEFEEEYLSYIQQSKTAHYIRSVKLSFKQLTTTIKDIPLNHISTRLIDQFISEVYSRSPYAAKLYYSTLKAAFTKAVNWNYLNENPFKKIKAPKLPKSFPAFISETELIKILNNTKSQLLKDIFTTAFYTGMRLGEILNMKWNWIDFNQLTITVRNSKDFQSKSKRERIIPIHPKVVGILKGHFPLGVKAQNNLVFYRVDDIKLNENYVSKQFKKAVRDAKLNDGIHFHSLRHSFASALVQRNVSLYIVKQLMGHENISTTQIYSHLKEENLTQAVNLL